MIVCRNLLIYLNTRLQQRLIPVFHYALKPSGWMFLGSAENIAGRNDLFDNVEPGLRIYRKHGSQSQSVPMPLMEQQPVASGSSRTASASIRREVDHIDVAARRVLDRYGPAFVVVNAGHEIVHSSSRTSKFLELNEGPPSRKVTDLAKRGLRSALRGAIESARNERKRFVKRDVTVEVDSESALHIDLIADPLNDQEVLLVFREKNGGDSLEGDVDAHVDGYSSEERIRQLEDDLDDTRLRLRTTVEELETSNEELKSSNEEMMSMNEELQSANEELATVNEELKNKVDQLARTNADLHNFIESTQMPTVFLDRGMRVRSFTPASKALFRFQEQDQGRLFSDVSSRVDHKRLEQLGRKVLETGEPEEEELVLDNGAEVYVLRVLPYRAVDDAIEGVIMVFSDISKITQAQADIARSESLVRQRVHEIETLYKTAPVGMAMLDRNRRFMRVNQHFADLAGDSVEGLMGRSLSDRLPALAERMEGALKDVFEQGKPIANLEAPVRVNDNDELRDFLIDLYAYEEDEKITAAGLVVKDVSELRRLERELRRLMDELQHRVKNTLATVVSIVNQTSRTKGNRADLIDTLKARIEALAATHSLLTASDWREVSLREVLSGELSPYDNRAQVTLRGPDVQLPPKHALTLTLAIHELATNAAKYGALARESGRLSVEWFVNLDATGRVLTIDWTEIGVPEIGSSKVKSGFGTKLIRSAVVHDLQGECEYTLATPGLRCKLKVPY
jgi:two-component system CheB/CheR fusion protein